MHDNIITLTIENDLTSAYIIKGLLEEHDIECFIANENITTANPLYMNAVGGLRIQILENDIEVAEDILANYRRDMLAADTEKEMPLEDNETKVRCPKCGSDDVRKEDVSAMAFVFSILLLGIPIPFLKRKYHCFNCQNEWK
jgi:DNA-directed RNA polymerase subunit RPC12/RpoP